MRRPLIIATSALAAASLAGIVWASHSNTSNEKLRTSAEPPVTTQGIPADTASTATIPVTGASVASLPAETLMSARTTEPKQLLSDHAVASFAGSTVMITAADGVTSELKTPAPIVGLQFLSAQTGCVATWDGTTVTLLRTDDLQTLTPVASHDLPLVNGIWVAAGTSGACDAAVNVAQGMNSNGVLFGTTIQAVAVVPGPFALQGEQGYMTGGATHGYVTETHDAGASWAPSLIPPELEGASFGLPLMSATGAWLPYSLPSSADDGASTRWTLGILANATDSHWRDTRSTISTADVGFVYAVADGSLDAVAADGSSVTNFDPTTGGFADAGSVAVPKGHVILDAYTQGTSLSGLLTAATTCDETGSCTTTSSTWLLNADGSLTPNGT